MKVLKIVVISLVALVALLWVISFFLPSETHVERSVTIDAPVEAVFAEVNNLKNLNNWSPWHKIDPNTEYSYEGPDAGVGAKMSWTSDHRDVGSGSQWIVESVPNQFVKTNLLFEGFADTAQASFTVAPEGDQYKVTWDFDTEMSGFNKYFGLAMDGMLGPQYEEGLANLKALAESKPTYSIDIGVEDHSGLNYLGIMETVSPQEISAKMGEMFGELMQYMTSNNLEMAGHAMAVYPRWSEESIDMECALPVAQEVDPQHERIMYKSIPAGKVIKAVHMGDYHLLEETHSQVDQYIADQGLQTGGAPFEVYVTDPGAEPDTSKWVTHVYYPLAN